MIRAVAASPQSLRGCAKSVQASQPRARAAQGAAHCESREPSECREKRGLLPGKSSGIVTQERHYLTTLYARANVSIMSVELNLIFSELEIIIEVSVNKYISMN